MQITASPTRGHGHPGLVRVGLAVWVLLALALLLPPALGLDPHVVRDDAMGGDYGRGALVLGETVPGELTVGDVIVFRAPAGDREGDWVTRRVVDLRKGQLVTGGDATGAADPWLLGRDAAGVLIASSSVPWLGYPVLAVVGAPSLLLAALVLAGLFAALLRLRRRPVDAGTQPVRPAARPPGVDAPLVR